MATIIAIRLFFFVETIIGFSSKNTLEMLLQTGYFIGSQIFREIKILEVSSKRVSYFYVSTSKITEC